MPPIQLGHHDHNLRIASSSWKSDSILGKGPLRKKLHSLNAPGINSHNKITYQLSSAPTLNILQIFHPNYFRFFFDMGCVCAVQKGGNFFPSIHTQSACSQLALRRRRGSRWPLPIKWLLVTYNYGTYYMVYGIATCIANN